MAHYETKNGVLYPIESIYEKNNNSINTLRSVFDYKNGELKKDFESKIVIIKNGIIKRNFTIWTSFYDDGSRSSPRVYYRGQSQQNGFIRFTIESTNSSQLSAGGTFCIVPNVKNAKSIHAYCRLTVQRNDGGWSSNGSWNRVNYDNLDVANVPTDPNDGKFGFWWYRYSPSGKQNVYFDIYDAYYDM